MKVTISRKAHFNAAHRLYNPKWTDEKNKKVFGKCANPHFHGHNYELIVSVTGEINPDTGYVMNIEDLKKIIKKEVDEPFDHKNLNIEVKEFQKILPSTENLVVIIYNKIKKHLDKKKSLSITLYETPRNFATYKGEEK